jgi:hypothetical protein
VSIGFLDHDGAVMIDVRCTEQARDQRMGEKGAADPVRLLGVFVGC